MSDPKTTAGVMIPASEILDLVRGAIQFPFAQVCKHLVACDLLELLERHGCRVEGLIPAVVNADDERALELLS